MAFALPKRWRDLIFMGTENGGHGTIGLGDNPDFLAAAGRIG
jgi:hypothetical protein